VTRLACLISATIFAVQGYASEDPRYHVGKPATQSDIDAVNIDIRPDGLGLPPGRGSVMEGKRLYEQKCAACHGTHGQGNPDDALVSTPDNEDRQTIGNHWPYATSIFDYIRRAMPFEQPGSLADNEVYALTAYLLYLNEIVPDHASLDAASLTRVRMPARDLFVTDDRRGGEVVR